MMGIHCVASKPHTIKTEARLTTSTTRRILFRGLEAIRTACVELASERQSLHNQTRTPANSSSLWQR